MKDAFCTTTLTWKFSIFLTKTIFCQLLYDVGIRVEEGVTSDTSRNTRFQKKFSTLLFDW